MHIQKTPGNWERRSSVSIYYPFGGTAQIIMAIININAWNRIGVSLHMQPE